MNTSLVLGCPIFKGSRLECQEGQQEYHHWRATGPNRAQDSSMPETVQIPEGGVGKSPCPPTNKHLSVQAAGF